MWGRFAVYNYDPQRWLCVTVTLGVLACSSTPASDDTGASQSAGTEAPSGGAGAGAPAAASGKGGAAGTGGVAAVGGRVAAAGGGAAGSLASFGIDDSQGWVLTVYHTPVESFHSDRVTAVSGCVQKPCTTSDTIGRYPADFVQAVKDEGAGRITSGDHAGKYLNWSMDTGYWLDDAPRDARGQALIPWVSAAADPKVPFGVQFKVADCGVDQAEGTAIDSAVCTTIEAASWSVNDRFEAANVNAHFDLYIGEEDRSDFDATSPYLVTTAHAQITLLQ